MLDENGDGSVNRIEFKKWWQEQERKFKRLQDKATKASVNGHKCDGDARCAQRHICSLRLRGATHGRVEGV